MTPSQVYAESALNIAHGGVHLFKKGDEVLSEELNTTAGVELYLGGKWTKYANLTAARAAWNNATHNAKRKDGAGYVRINGSITVIISQNGRVWRIAYLGRDGDMSLAMAGPGHC